VPLGDQGQFLAGLFAAAVAVVLPGLICANTYPKYLVDLFTAKAEATKTRSCNELGRGAAPVSESV